MYMRRDLIMTSIVRFCVLVSLGMGTVALCSSDGPAAARPQRLGSHAVRVLDGLLTRRINPGVKAIGYAAIACVYPRARRAIFRNPATPLSRLVAVAESIVAVPSLVHMLNDLDSGPLCPLRRIFNKLATPFFIGTVFALPLDIMAIAFGSRGLGTMATSRARAHSLDASAAAQGLFRRSRLSRGSLNVAEAVLNAPGQVARASSFASMVGWSLGKARNSLHDVCQVYLQRGAGHDDASGDEAAGGGNRLGSH